MSRPATKTTEALNYFEQVLKPEGMEINQIRDAIIEKVGCTRGLWYSSLRPHVLKAMAKQPEEAAPFLEDDVALEIPALPDEAKATVNMLLGKVRELECQVNLKEEAVRAMTAKLASEERTVRLIRKIAVQLLEEV